MIIADDNLDKIRRWSTLLWRHSFVVTVFLSTIKNIDLQLTIPLSRIRVKFIQRASASHNAILHLLKVWHLRSCLSRLSKKQRNLPH